MENYGVIYCAYNKINSKRYIGQTKQKLRDRIRGHYNHEPDIYFHRALHKYKEEDWEWEIIDTALTKEELDEKEKYWILYYDTKDPSKGYNILDGGSGAVLPKEQIREMRDNFVEKYSKEQKENVRTIKNIKCIETGQIFKNAAEASRIMNVHHSHMVAAANGKLKSAGGYHWEWCLDMSLFPNALYCVELNRYYTSYYEAQRKDHFSSTHLGRAFKKQGSPFQYAGYTFYKINSESPE